MSEHCWAEDFSYRYFINILKAIKSNFQVHLLSDAPKFIDIFDDSKYKLILRHDVDVSLKRALEMAQIEKKYDISATYMVIANYQAITEWPLYNVKDRTSKDILKNLIDLGHEIGLHYVLDDKEQCYDYKNSEIKQNILSTRKLLEDSIKKPVKTLSFHRPKSKQYEGPLIDCGMINAYSKKLMCKRENLSKSKVLYHSDSGGIWKYGEPLPFLIEPTKPLLQLLIHPIWWGELHLPWKERLHVFRSTETSDMSFEEAKKFDVALNKTLPEQFNYELY